jgi:hypothetical protein
MRANSLYSRGTSGFAVVALTLLLASCIKSTPTYKIGVAVSGLSGAGLVLQDNGGDDLAISANGYFTFSKQLKKNASYNVTVFTQPPAQSCTVANGTGTATSDVTDVAVGCVANAPTTFTVGGTVSGLTGTGLVLQNNGGNNLAIAAPSSTFTFSTALPNAATYSVTVLTQPTGQGCQVANGSGSIAGANVINVAVTCVTPPAAPTVNPLSFGVKELRFSWTAVSGATFYRLLENPDGASGFGQVATNITATNFNYTIPVHRRLNASYKVEACNVGGCTASVALDLGSDLVKAIGFAKASNTGAGDQFGTSVAVSGDGNTLAVGAFMEDSSMAGVTAGSVPAAGNAATDAGAVYVFARIAGVWSQQAYVKASNPNPVAGDQFGVSVALSNDGNTLAVGAVGQAALSGAAYVFTRSAGTWSQQAVVKASNAEADDEFGWVVALSGDGNTLAVGAPFESSSLSGVTAGVIDETTAGNGAFFAGAAYVYTRSGGAWPQQAYVKASNTASSDLFGYSVALSGDGNTLAVGAPLEDGGHTGVTAGPVNEAATGNAATDSGAAYVYTRSGSAWSQQAYVKASNTGSGDNFGTSLSLASDGNTLAIGAPLEDNAFVDSGAAYVYTRTAGAWAQQAYVKASNTGLRDNFGTSLALSGDGTALAVGAPFEDSNTTGIGSTPVDDGLVTNTGAVYFYRLSAGTWSQQAYVKATNTGDLDEFGWSLALSGDGNTLAVGAPMEDGSGTGIGAAQDNNGAGDAGAVYLY